MIIITTALPQTGPVATNYCLLHYYGHGHRAHIRLLVGVVNTPA